MMTLTWNGRNELGGGAFVKENPGITPFGRAVISENERYGIINDVSHASDALFTTRRNTQKSRLPPAIPMRAPFAGTRAI